jgi:3-dehydroquinate synthase
MPTIRVSSAAGPYDVYCGAGLLRRTAELLDRFRDASGVYILSSPNVWACCGRPVFAAVGKRNRREVILFDDSEASKNLAAIEAIARNLLAAGADRRAVVVAVGGGVVGDVAGFAAASYLRGVDLVHIPTTLVAQVDSAIGGKTGVNLPEGKNLIGAFYSPKLVIADPGLLLTLPHREYRSGIFEVIKYALIADSEMFAFLERRMLPLLRRDPETLAWVIARCVRIKADVVRRDEREGGLREILNFGHTLGHALESATKYRRFRHGEAIAWGMIAAALFGVATGRFGEAAATRLIRLIASVGPLPKINGIRAAELRNILAGDKKARGGRVRWVLPLRIGKVQCGVELPWVLVSRTFAALPQFAETAK